RHTNDNFVWLTGNISFLNFRLSELTAIGNDGAERLAAVVLIDNHPLSMQSNDESVLNWQNIPVIVIYEIHFHLYY
ncbi:hypothetical protein BLA29_011354, partial [Euroglyphus maynei]